VEPARAGRYCKVIRRIWNFYCKYADEVKEAVAAPMGKLFEGMSE